SCAAVVLSLSVAAAAQVNTQTPTQSPVPSNEQTAPSTPSSSSSATRAQTGQQMTIVGCVAREGTSDNEFVLNNASMVPPANLSGGVAGSTSATTPKTGAAGAIGTTGSTSTMTYVLGGSKEKDLSQYVGQRVEIVAKADTSATAAAAVPDLAHPPAD